MKAKPVKLIYGQGYVACTIAEATHVTLNFPGPVGQLTLPVICHGPRAGTNCWTWNGSTESPTLRPSIKTTGTSFVCHSWVNEGRAQFLEDSTHEHAGRTLDLLDVPETE